MFFACCSCSAECTHAQCEQGQLPCKGPSTTTRPRWCGLVLHAGVVSCTGQRAHQVAYSVALQDFAHFGSLVLGIHGPEGVNGPPSRQHNPGTPTRMLINLPSTTPMRSCLMTAKFQSRRWCYTAMCYGFSVDITSTGHMLCQVVQLAWYIAVILVGTCTMAAAQGWSAVRGSKHQARHRQHWRLTQGAL